MENTPPKIKMEPKNGGDWKMIFLFRCGGVFRFHMLVFEGLFTPTRDIDDVQIILARLII